jgi:cardiolipin synthase
MAWLNALVRYWPYLVAALTFCSALLASAHALLNKRDSRAAVLWLGFIWLIPLLGPILYLSLGVNRISRRAKSLGVEKQGTSAPKTIADVTEPQIPDAYHLKMIAQTVERVTKRPLTSGNSVRVLVNGDEAFPAMLKTIDAAKISISLVTYIFDNDRSGKEFAFALGRAVKRGVEVRVLIDDAGARYSWPSIFGVLKRRKVKVRRFLPTFPIFWHFMTLNLRNHRKILVVDGQVAFTGGMNIRYGNMLTKHPRSPVQDLHFQVEGPVVAQLQTAFANDWAFATKEILQGETWFPKLNADGGVFSRVITDGPDSDMDKLRWTFLAGLAEAQERVQILTPYFLPDPAIITALNLAALRGVQVDIILPARNNLPYMHWASRAMWWQMLQRGCRFWLTQGPFDHSKLMIVDGNWVLFGSANWDPRSLRLNFELNVECYERELAEKLEALIKAKLRGAHEVTLAEVDGRSVLIKLQDAIARLFMPYL